MLDHGQFLAKSYRCADTIAQAVAQQVAEAKRNLLGLQRILFQGCVADEAEGVEQEVRVDLRFQHANLGLL